MKDLESLFKKIESLRVGVIGDLMLDTYMWGHVDRISPEAPVPVVLLDKKEFRIGGAGNVALNCKALGADVSVISITGDDEDGHRLESMIKEKNIRTQYLFKTSKRVTTNKTRVIGRNQQMIRLDAEMANDLQKHDEDLLLEKLAAFISEVKPDVLIFEDYNKGVLTEKVIKQSTGLCKKNGIITAVDPKRKNFFSYKEVNLFKPNLKEVKEALNIQIDDVNLPLLNTIHRELYRQLGHQVSLITLSDKGIYYHDPNTASLIPSHLRNIADVSGAGDTVIALASLVYAASQNTHLMAEVANIAGGLVCEEVGTAAVDKEKLLHECELLLT